MASHVARPLGSNNNPPSRTPRRRRQPAYARPSWLLLATLTTLVLGAHPAHASIGDRSPAYARCTSACEFLRCPPPHRADIQSTSAKEYAPPTLDDYPKSSLFWPCGDTCRYICQQYLTDLALSSATTTTTAKLEGLPAGEQVQFHGKWPFHRLDLSGLPWFPFLPLRLFATLFLPHVQEPLSVLFSLGNLWAHHRGLRALRTLAQKGRMTEGKRLARVYAIYAWSGIVAWIASTVFHTRDVDRTERFDYFAAAGTMLVGLWAGVVRVQGWYAPLSKGKSLAPTQRRAAFVWTLALLGVFVLHCGYLGSKERFDYTYNMQFNVTVALFTIALWAAWTYRQSRLPTPSNFSRRQLSSYPSARARFRAPHYLFPLPPLILLPLLTSLELLDFAPVGFGTGLRLLDAHALWHASTIPVVVMWYRFLIKDVRWIDGQGEGGDPNSVLPAAPGSASLDSSTTSAAAGNAATPNSGGEGSNAATPGGGGSSWVLERLEREGRKLGFALGGSSGASATATTTSGAVRRESSGGSAGGVPPDRLAKGVE
ncbi:hypothetical protein JCM10908_004495 [Rhodotorula pacifica]|uniref:Per1p n=1 Tax=Rhodotorula pacifica TaxID=1495444 RepID=UPI0031725422